MDILKIAAFSDGEMGGNPAGVSIASHLPTENEMQSIAAELGFSETVFVAPVESDGSGDMAGAWRVRYFSPESEVPFCGHATIALGAALAMRYGDGVYPLHLNNAKITVEGRRLGKMIAAALQSPPTHSKPVPPKLLEQALSLFSYSARDLNLRIPPALVHGGAQHLLLALNSREQLGAMHYQLEAGKALMREAGLVTIILAYAESAQLFHVRNPFASGGVYEDPATGAAAAALAGYLRDLHWPHGGLIDIKQGEDMGKPSRIRAEISPIIRSSIRVSGTARML